MVWKQSSPGPVCCFAAIFPDWPPGPPGLSETLLNPSDLSAHLGREILEEQLPEEPALRIQASEVSRSLELLRPMSSTTPRAPGNDREALADPSEAAGWVNFAQSGCSVQ